MRVYKAITAVLLGVSFFILVTVGVLADGPGEVVIVAPWEIVSTGPTVFSSTLQLMEPDTGDILFSEQFTPGPFARLIAVQVQQGDLYYYLNKQFHRAVWPIRSGGSISVTRSFSAVGYESIDHHDFELSPDGTIAAFAVYDNIVTDTTAYGGYVTQTIANNIIQVIDTEDNSLIAERDLSLTYPVGGTTLVFSSATFLSTYHTNSLDFSPDGELLMLNLKHYGLIVLDATQADLPTITFLPKGQHQEHHDMRWHHLISGSTYLVSGFSNNPTGVSAGVVYHFDVGAGELTEQYRCENPSGFASRIMGSTDYDPESGEMLVGWGASTGAGIVAPPTMYTRFDSDCNVIYEGPAGSGEVSYWARPELAQWRYYFPLIFGSGGITIE